MTDIKAIVKEAREAINHKDFHTSAKLCKIVLKRDKENYMALVFLGVSMQEVGPKEQAPIAFRKAIQLNSSSPLAWNGLASYYEKSQDPNAKQELVKAYISLLDVETSDPKLLDYCNKLASLYEYGDVADICMAIYRATKSNKCSDNGIIDMNILLASLLSKIKDLSKELTTVQEEVLSLLTSNQKTVSIEYYSTYLMLLYKQRKYELVLEQAQRMHCIFESDMISLNWMCKIYNETFVECEQINGKLIPNVDTACDALLRLEPNSAMALFTCSIQLFKQDRIVEAKDLLKKVTTSRSGLLHAWILLTECLMLLGLYEDALQASSKADKLLLSVNSPNQILKRKLDQLIIHIKSRSQDSTCWKEVIHMYQCLDDELKSECMSDAIRANINLGDYVTAEQLMNERGESNIDDTVLVLLRAQMLHKQQDYTGALDLLQQMQPPLSEWWLEMASIYFDMDQHNKCIDPLSKAVKCGSDNYRCFLKLGDYYDMMNDLDKARRCYEKAFKLNDKCHEVVIKLSRVYRKQKMWDQNTMLLEAMTAAAAVNPDNCWAYFQLGLNYLEQGDYLKAIENLRYVLRVDNSNGHCWESLADAYLSRGAHKSALKCYQKAAELNEGNLYSSLQIATIKQIMGEYAEANAAFSAILSDKKGYVPALKGLADTCLRQAKHCLKDQRLGTARDYCQIAVDKITLALEQRGELSCLWKVLGDCCVFVGRLPKKHCWLLICSKLLGEISGDSANKRIEQDELYSLAIRCYSKAVTLMKDNMLLWHDLATALLCHAHSCQDTEMKRQLLDKAYACAQHCTLQNPTHWQHWNLLANIALNDPPNYALAQHALIKAVSINYNSAMAWCNLGTLYLILDEVKLANKAFSKAQRSDPNYVNSWIGQALIAERMGYDDAMDLFRHSTQLSVHGQGGIGYGHWVCKTLLESPPDAHTYTIHNMHAIPLASDALTFYTEKNSEDSCAWNMLGMLKERLGLKFETAEAFKNALERCPQQYKDCCRVNYGRTLYKLGNYTTAIQIFSQVEAASFSSGSGLALALFKNGQYEESYETYQSTLNWLTEEQSKQSELLVALASMLYMAQGPDAAKTLLFQSLELKSPSPWALYATLSLALLHKDGKLTRMVLKELASLKDSTEDLPHYSLLLAFVYLLQGDDVKGVREVSRLVHRHPDQPSPWLTLATVLLHNHKARTRSATTATASAAASCASMAMSLGRNNMDVTMVLCLVAVASYLAGQYRQALIAAQKAIHCYPDIPASWAVLIAALTLCTKRLPSTLVDKQYVHRIALYIESLKPSPSLISWLNNSSV